jgi:hypothetical protein
MAEPFLRLSVDDRREVLAVAADRGGRSVHLLEKDVWVVWALDVLFRSPLGEHLVFKGGTSLSKAYGVIRRFSEDVDLTYSIKALAPDLVAADSDAVPSSRSEEKRWTSEVRRRLPVWVHGAAAPVIAAALKGDGLDARLSAEGDRLFLDYNPMAKGTGYVGPRVLLEFGARSTGEPAAHRDVVCDADALVDDILFPKARPKVMLAERTFWEKVTAMHVYCRQARLRGDRFSRHWHDVARLDEAGIAASAISDRGLAFAVARHKHMFFVEKVPGEGSIDYVAAVSGGLQLVPADAMRVALAEDYARMVEDGLLLEDAESFDTLMERCASIATRANEAAGKFESIHEPAIGSS